MHEITEIRIVSGIHARQRPRLPSDHRCPAKGPFMRQSWSFQAAAQNGQLVADFHRRAGQIRLTTITLLSSVGNPVRHRNVSLQLSRFICKSNQGAQFYRISTRSSRSSRKTPNLLIWTSIYRGIGIRPPLHGVILVLEQFFSILRPLCSRLTIPPQVRRSTRDDQTHQIPLGGQASINSSSIPPPTQIRFRTTASQACMGTM